MFIRAIVLSIVLAVSACFADECAVNRKDSVSVGASIIKSFRKNLDSAKVTELAEVIYEASRSHNQIEYPFLLAIVAAESRFNSNAVSPAGAIGLGQLMPSTAERMAKQLNMPYDKSHLYVPTYNMKLSVQYLARLFKRFDDVMMVAAAYNGGIGGAINYKKWVENELASDSVSKETIAYVGRVMDRYAKYSNMMK